MVVYFTGTGNSKFAADVLAEKLEDECFSLNEAIKNSRSLKLQSEKPYVIVAPIHAGCYPLIVVKNIKNAEFGGNKRVYFVSTMGAPSKMGGGFYEKLALSKGLDFGGYCGVVMQNNFLPGDTMPEKTKADEMLFDVFPELEKIAEKIKSGKSITVNEGAKPDAFMAGLMGKLFGTFAGKFMKMKVDNRCDGCGICAEYCPVNNIELVSGKAVMKNKCVTCFSCINRCLPEAINVMGKTEKSGRFICPDYKEWKEKHSQRL